MRHYAGRLSAFQSTPPARGATPGVPVPPDVPRWISIHAPREGGDLRVCRQQQDGCYFNPRPPRGGRRHRDLAGDCVTYFNPRPPRGGRHSNAIDPIGRYQFQSTPPARGATAGQCCYPVVVYRFQSTPPARGATAILPCRRPAISISIHAPREGGDDDLYDCNYLMFQFQSTPPARGATSAPVASAGILNRFQSTPPARGATVLQAEFFRPVLISIHAPREGGDGVGRNPEGVSGYFNPRPPRGGRLRWWPANRPPDLFQSTPPARGATSAGTLSPIGYVLFQSTPPARGATSGIPYKMVSTLYFNPRPPRGGRLRQGGTRC